MYATKLSVLGTALLTLAPYANAHMIMANPVPYGDPDNSPLSPDGSNFPCKNVAYTIKQQNDWKVGSQQTLSWKGSAVHGGGSCQILVTTDKEPTKGSKFKVIYSIEGGCPGVGGPAEFPFTVPKELPNGDMAMAVTWFNKIGNREIYMNCAPISVSGGSDDKSEFEKLPDMALANVAVGEGASCKTSESKDYTFANPGKYTTRIGSGPFVPLCGGEAVGGAPGVPAPSGQPGAPAPSGQPGQPPAQSPNNGLYTPSASQSPAPSVSASQAPVPSAPASQAPQMSSPASSSGVITSTVRTLLTVTAPTISSPSTRADAQPSASPSSMPTASSGAASSAPATSQPSQAPSTPDGASSTCTTDSAIVCNGTDQFGICNHGNIVWQSVAPGTKCTDGKIMKRHEYSHRAQRTQY